ncbi:MAG: hypothetical protein KGY99_00290 [Phycisphaerae bacterium]|nr:hypothetical protein [Phycisphaerae bacterium]
MSRPRVLQVIFVVAAVGFATAAVMLRRPLDRISEESGLTSPGNVVAEEHPQLAVWTTAFGGLRAPVVAGLWIRADQHVQAGRFYDAKQLGDLICQLQPRFPGVWGYHSWNMAWNISVKTKTREQRWLWVTNGMRLLRDRGIPLNPRALGLYKDLAWLFYSKMGGHTDEMHRYYKKRWADEMQRLLGAPPMGTTDEVIDAFRPVATMADRRLDRDPRRQGRSLIQGDEFARLLADRPATRAYLAELRRRLADALGAGVVHPRVRRVADDEPLIDIADEPLLRTYNLFSRDEAVRNWRFAAPDPVDEREQRLAEWINDDATREARNALLAFVRAQKLWNVYKMDATFMLRIMEKWHIPLDWRMCRAHGLYWNSYGMNVCEGVMALDDLNTVNTGRTLLFCLRDMVFYGKVMYRPSASDPLDPDKAQLIRRGDWRFIKPAQAQQLELIEKIREPRGESFKENIYRAGHINWLTDCIKMLYAGGRRRWPLAKDLLAWIKDNYDPKGPEWERLDPRSNDDLRRFVRYRLTQNGSPIISVAVSQIEAALIAALEHLTDGNTGQHAFFLNHAQRVYGLYQRDAPPRLKLAPFARYYYEVLAHMIAHPASLGTQLDKKARRALYVGFRGAPFAPQLYQHVRLFVEPNWQADGWRDELEVSFKTAFRKPPDYDAFLEQQRRQREAPATAE